MKNMEKKWAEIKAQANKKYKDGTIETIIDGWLTHDQMEEGKTIATVKNAIVTYLDSSASINYYAQTVISNTVKKHISHIIKYHNV